MKFSKKIVILTAVMLVIVSTVQELQAGIVDASSGNPTASGPGLISMSYNNTINVFSGNDNVVGASTNILNVAQKDFGSINYIDMLFKVNDKGDGTTEYQVVEGVNNSTGFDWTDYHMVLGFGTGGSFVPSIAGDGLDFDALVPDSPFSFAPFTTITITEDTIDVEDGIFPNGAFIVFSFPLDVPDGITEFTIRQLPTIPEPSSIILSGMGIISLLMFGRRRRKIGFRK